MTLRFSSVASPHLPGLFPEEADKAALMKNDVFISHTPNDIHAAEAIVAALEASRLRCFIAPRDIPAGMEWAAAIIDAIFETRLFLLLHSASANQSHQMARELQLVHDRHIGIFPVRLDDSPANPNIEFFLKRQSVFHATPFADRLPELVEAVHIRLGDQAAGTTDKV